MTPLPSPSAQRPGGPPSVPGMVRARVRAALRRPARAPRPARPVPLTPEEAEQRALLLRLMSLLLQYPDAELTAARPVITSTVAALPPSSAAGHLAEFTAWFTGEETEALERTYVETFDLRRRSSLYLTYYLHGDTRRRGMALLTLAQRYRAAGWDTDGGELPDHLPVVLEFAALTGPGRGEAPLRQHRRGIELIHRALTDADSPYRHVFAALTELLPPPTEADLRAVAELAAQGPPDEEVGLDPYGAGEFAPPDTFVPPGQAPPTLVPPSAPTRQEARR
ncbi:nitrate reductase [Streptomyces toyocaensis]|uniref:Nitrate reductase n=2 Tax=Streptomyces toyocaensis TaxID=55952 RepID=A0A081XNE3_STRTO|nr:nitrate reductase [Streptomyces toyocaensis]